MVAPLLVIAGLLLAIVLALRDMDITHHQRRAAYLLVILLALAMLLALAANLLR